jgi:hypothetical protein
MFCIYTSPSLCIFPSTIKQQQSCCSSLSKRKNLVISPSPVFSFSKVYLYCLFGIIYIFLGKRDFSSLESPFLLKSIKIKIGIVTSWKSIRARLVACEESNQALGSQEVVDWIPGLPHFRGPHGRQSSLHTGLGIPPNRAFPRGQALEGATRGFACTPGEGA